MVHCCAVGCKNRSERKSKNITFHTFPKCPEIRQKWIKAIRRDDWEPNKYSRLCSKHFEKSCFIDGLLIRKLKSDAVPTIFSDYPKYYQPATPKNKKRKIQENQSSNTDHDDPVSPSDMKLIKQLAKERSKACRRLRVVKSLREGKRRLQKKIAELQTIVDVLEKGWKKHEQSFDILASVGEQNKDIIPHLCSESKVFKELSNMYEGLICICCLATENLVDLFSASDPNMEHTENYAEILEACFRIRVTQDEGHAHVCEECIQQLKNSNNFKKQILNSISILTSVNVKQSIIKDEDMKNVDEANSQDNVSIKIEEDLDYEDVDPKSETVNDIQEDAESSLLKELCRESSYITTGFGCDECGKIFSDNSILKMHQCVNYPKYQCEQCGEDFMTTIALNNHSITHDEEGYQCGNCSKTFSSLKLLGRHQESEHSNIDENHMYACDYCDRKFSNLESKDRHVQKEHEVVLYSCPLCSYKSKKQYLRSHMANRHHIGDKKHQCHYCKKKFSRGIGLKQHLRIHLNDRKYVCRVCNRNFVHKCSLKGHIQAHIRRGDYDGDPQELLDQSERPNEKYEPIEDEIKHEDSTVASTEESQDGMVEEFLMEDDELDEIRNALNQEGR